MAYRGIKEENRMGAVIIEGIGACFILLILCVVGISNGAVGAVHLYEKDVQERAIEIGLTTAERIKRNALIFKLAGLIPLLAFIIISVYCLNGARGFWEPFWQISVISLMQGLFDRIFIDWYWVGKTKAWDIPGTEDLKPYISGKPIVIKWVFTLVGYPVLAAIISAVMMIFIK